jgi:hypothetical protein
MNVLDYIHFAGTSEGATKGWDERGRGRAKKNFEHKPSVVYTPREKKALKDIMRVSSQTLQQYLKSERGVIYEDSLGRSTRYTGKEHEISNSKLYHQYAVKYALTHGMHVSARVLKDYPDLKAE